MCLDIPIKALSSLNIKRITTNVSVVQAVTRSNRQDTRRLRFFFFHLQCQTAGKLDPPGFVIQTQFDAGSLLGHTGTHTRQSRIDA